MSTTPLPTPASRRHNRIASLLGTMLDVREDLLEAVVEAKAGEDHLAFGYPSWPAYVAGEFGLMLADLNREDRRLAALALSETGMSSRAIAPLVGVSDSQVRADLRQVGSNFPPSTDLEHGRNDLQASASTSAVVGLDGKTYERPARKPSRRPSLPDATWTACRELQKAADRLERLVCDDRFPQHREVVRKQHAADLARITKTLWAVRSKIGSALVDGEVVQ